MGSYKSKAKQQQLSNLQAESYYKNLTTSDQLTNDNSPKEQIQMTIQIRNAERYQNYTVSLFYSFDENKGNCVGTTKSEEADENGNINFEYGFILDYFFEKQQFLTFNIQKNSQNYNVSSTLGNVMGSRGQTLLKDFGQGEKLIIAATTLKNNNMNIGLSFNIIYNVPNVAIFYTIKKIRNNLINLDNTKTSIGDNNVNQFISVYKSEVKSYANGQYQFNKLKIPSSVLCNGEFDSKILIEFYDYNNQKSLGIKETTVDNLTNLDKYFTFNSGLRVNCLCEFIKEYTFLDYLRGGLQLALSIGIDFTGSNGNPLDQISLHYTQGNSPNFYERAIRSCGDIVAYYDYDQLFPVYGYGAMTPNSRVVSHCFPLNLSNDPNIKTIDEVLNTYRKTVKQLTFSGPTYFAPLLNQIISSIRQENNNSVYQILLILTDGLINDMDKTIDALVEASYLPLSVIIVGIGRADFTNMKVLDADEAPLIDSKKRQSVRDLVQFVPFYQFENNPKKLAEEVLEEVPRQVVEYFKLINMPPGDPVVNFI